MQSKSSKIQTRPIEDLLGRIRTLRQKGEREIRIPANEADKLATRIEKDMLHKCLKYIFTEDVVQNLMDIIKNCCCGAIR